MNVNNVAKNPHILYHNNADLLYPIRCIITLNFVQIPLPLSQPVFWPALCG